jgi:hypothetical protein
MWLLPAAILLGLGCLFILRPPLPRGIAERRLPAWSRPLFTGIGATAFIVAIGAGRLWSRPVGAPFPWHELLSTASRGVFFVIFLVAVGQLACARRPPPPPSTSSDEADGPSPSA